MRWIVEQEQKTIVYRLKIYQSHRHDNHIHTMARRGVTGNEPAGSGNVNSLDIHELMDAMLGQFATEA